MAKLMKLAATAIPAPVAPAIAAARAATSI